MPTPPSRLLAAVAIAAGLLPGGPSADAATRLRPGPAPSIVLEGSSNVRDWTCRGAALHGEAVLPSSLDRVHDVLDRIENGDISPLMDRRDQASFAAPAIRMEIPVETLRCGIAAMDRDMYDALKAATHPSIIFEFRRVAGPIVHRIDEGTYRIPVEGELRLAGTRRTVTIEVTGRRLSRESFRLEGALPVRMTDFGIAPPTGLLGLIRARDALTVRFDFQFRAAPQPARAAATGGAR